MTGSALAQALGFFLSPVISRLYSPSDFGRYGSFSAIAGIIAAGVTLDYCQAIMLPKEKAEAANILVMSFLISGIVTLLCVLVFTFAPGTINRMMNTSGAWPLILLATAAFVAGISRSLQAWAIRAMAFKTTSAAQVVRSLTSNGAKITLGYLRFESAGLMISNVMADLAVSFSLGRVFWRDAGLIKHAVRWSRMRNLAWAYRDFPLFSASQNIINTLSNGLPVLLITRFFGVAEAGAYAFAMGVLYAPVGVVLTALRQVLFQKACEFQHQGKRLSSLFVRMTAGLFGGIIVPSAVLFIWSPELFSWIFGAQWRLSGIMARSLIIWLVFSFSNLPAVLFAKIIRIQRFTFIFDLCLLAMRSTVLILGGLHLSVVQTVTLFAIVGAVMNLVLILRVGRSVMKKEGIGRLEDILRPI